MKSICSRIMRLCEAKSVIQIEVAKLTKNTPIIMRIFYNKEDAIEFKKEAQKPSDFQDFEFDYGLYVNNEEIKNQITEYLVDSDIVTFDKAHQALWDSIP